METPRETFTRLTAECQKAWEDAERTKWNGEPAERFHRLKRAREEASRAMHAQKHTPTICP